MTKEIKEDEIQNLFKFEEFKFLDDEYDYIDITEIEERHYRIQQINQDATLLRDIFNDLREIVYGQQDAIDNIEENVMETRNHAEMAEEELVKAEIYQKKVTRRYFLLSSILIAGVSTPVALSIGIKAGLGTAGGMGIGSMVYRMI